MHSVSRRGFLVLGGTGAAGAALASCGGQTTERDQSDDAALLEAAHGAETSLGAAYGAAIKAAKPQQAAALNQFRGASAKRASRLVQLVTDAGGEPSGGDSGFGSPIETANGAIAAYRAGAGPLSSEQARGTMIAFLAAVAAELSVLSEVDDAQPVPHAFVTGGEQEPLEPAGETTTTTDTTTTTTTTSTGEGQ